MLSYVGAANSTYTFIIAVYPLTFSVESPPPKCWQEILMIGSIYEYISDQ